MSPLSRLRSAQPWLLSAGAAGLLVTASILAYSGLVGQESAPAAHPSLTLAGFGEDLLDSDLDGLPDAVENFVYGSNPAEPMTSGSGIPDGWLAKHGFDPTDAGVRFIPAATPPDDGLPAVYAGTWPTEFRWTLFDVYAYGRPAEWSEKEQGLWDSGLDPGQSQTPSGLPASWLHRYGLPILDLDVAQTTGAGDTFTVREDYEHGTDPTKADTDSDGLTDSQEVRQYHTDPRKESTSGSGIPDGWLARFQLDPADSQIASRDPAFKGMTIGEVFTYNQARFGRALALAGEGLHPNRMSTSGGPVPDGWMVKNGLDPLQAGATDAVVQSAPSLEANGTLPIAAFVLTVGGAYAYQRPAAWDEATMGPWPDGLDPTRTDQDGDGLMDAVELRGWFITRTLGLGPHAGKQVVHVTSDPRRADTDGDGLNDTEEHDGRAVRPEGTYMWKPSDPANPDSAFSGIDDTSKVLGIQQGAGRIGFWASDPVGNRVVLLEPTVMDTDADFLPDGEEAAFWVGRAESANVPYQARYANSRFTSTDQWMANLPPFGGRLPSEAQAKAALGPGGDLDGDGKANLVDADADGDGVPDGAENNPDILRLLDFPIGGPRASTDAANPDTDGDGLPDAWELTYGSFGFASRAWDLDPSRFRSDGQTPDGEANLDGDGADWVAIATTTAGSTSQPRRFEFTNFQEFRAGTHPRLMDQDGDGLQEGWGFFWSQLYPSLLTRAASGDASAQAELGDVVPELSKLPAQQRRQAIGTGLQPGLGQVAKGEVPYIRFALAPEAPAGQAAADALLLRASEKFTNTWPKTVAVLENGGTQNRRIASIEGLRVHRFADDALLRLNPYLDDTDGDKIPDIWESLNPCTDLGSGSAEPSVPDGSRDPDRDGLSNSQEYSYKTNPCLADTDLGGLKDGDDFTDRLDPTQDAVGEGAGHSDEDKISDERELQVLGTNPFLADTDRDGLLDGANIELQSDSPLEAHQVLRQSLLDLGIAHYIDGKKYTFFGEESASPETVPTRSSSRANHNNIPDGWLVYYAQPQGSAVLAEKYSCNRPAWWSESDMGVWWWGVAPTQTACLPDMDFDGLNDRNGEDPVPAASHANQPNRTLGDLPAALELGLGVKEQLLLGQGWGECAGDPASCRDSWSTLDFDGDGLYDWQDRMPVMLQEVTHTLVGSGEKLLPKETNFTVSGQLVLLCDASPCESVSGFIPAPNRAIVLRLQTAGTLADVMGIAFTDDKGLFTMSACLCRTGEIAIPLEGITVQGQSNGIVQWRLDAGGAQVGSKTNLTLEVLATPAVFPAGTAHPQHGGWTIAGVPQNSTEGLVHNLTKARITSGTRLVLTEAPASIPWNPAGRAVQVAASLSDAAEGIPPAGSVVNFTFGNLQKTGPTDDSGIARVTFNLTSSMDGNITAGASYSGGGDFAGSTAVPRNVVLQRPTGLSTEFDVQETRLGTVLSIPVLVTSQGQPLEGAEARATLGPITASAHTNAQGKAVLSLLVTAAAPGPQALRIEVPESAGYAGIRIDRTLYLLTGSVLDVEAPQQAAPGQAVPVRGTLARTDGTALPAEVITFRLDGQPIAAQATTRANGTYQAVLQLPSVLASGAHNLTASFGGQTQMVEGTTASTTVQVALPAYLAVFSVSGARGTPARLTGTLLDAAGQGIPGQFIDLALDGAPAGRPLTDSSGAFALTLELANDTALGPHPVTARFSGSPDERYGPAQGAGVLHVATETALTLLLPDRLDRGANPIAGRLLMSSGAPVAGVQILLRASTMPQAVAMTTGPLGEFAGSVLVGPQAPPGLVDIEVAFGGDSTRAPSSASGNAHFRSPTRLSLLVPHEVGRGAEFGLRISLLDDRGQTLPDAVVQLTSFDADRNVTTGGETPSEVQLLAPLGWPLGNASFTATFAGTPLYDSATTTVVAWVKDGALIEFLNPPSQVRPGQALEVQVRVTDLAGNPVADADVGLLASNAGIAVRGTTNETGVATLALVAPPSGTLGLEATFSGTPELALARASAGAITVKAPPGPASWALAQAAVLAVAASAALLVAWRLWARRRAASSLADPLRLAAERITAGDPWTAAVLLAYRRLAEHLASLGFAERREESMRDFVTDLVQATRIRPETAVAFVNLVESVRYSGGLPGPGPARQARRTLQNLLDEMARSTGDHT